MKSLTLLLLLLSARSASASCNRADLKAVLDAFFLSATTRAKSPSTAPPALASGARITQNNIALRSLAASAWSNTTSLRPAFRIDALDAEACAGAAFVLASQGAAAAPALMSVRVATSAAEPRRVRELEILNVLRGSHAFFAPQDFPAAAPAMWAAPQAAPAVSSRAELVRLANEYPSGIQAGDGSRIAAGASCPRVENGVHTTARCNVGLAMFKQPVTNRRWVADTLTGVVLGEFYFDKVAAKGLNYGLWLNEYFKIDGGKMVGIQACMKELPGKFVDLWAP